MFTFTFLQNNVDRLNKNKATSMASSKQCLQVPNPNAGSCETHHDCDTLSAWYVPYNTQVQLAFVLRLVLSIIAHSYFLVGVVLRLFFFF